jgi:hypothetical protein
VTHVMWRGVRAKLLAHAGRIEAAAAVAREALGLIERTDLLTHHGDALLDLAEVLRLGERRAEADDAAREALALYKRKGNLVSAERARSGLELRRAGDSTEVDDAAVAVRERGPAGARRQCDGLWLGGARDG